MSTTSAEVPSLPLRRHGAADAAVQAAAAEGFFRNLILLGFARSAEARDAGVSASLRSGAAMFDSAKANEAGLLAAAAFLLPRASSSGPSKASSTSSKSGAVSSGGSMGHFGLMDGGTMRRELKARVREGVRELERTKAVPLGACRPSAVNHARGRAAQTLVWTLSVAAMDNAIRKRALQSKQKRLQGREKRDLHRDRKGGSVAQEDHAKIDGSHEVKTSIHDSQVSFKKNIQGRDAEEVVNESEEDLEEDLEEHLEEEEEELPRLESDRVLLSAKSAHELVEEFGALAAEEEAKFERVCAEKEAHVRQMESYGKALETEEAELTQKLTKLRKEVEGLEEELKIDRENVAEMEEEARKNRQEILDIAEKNCDTDLLREQLDILAGQPEAEAGVTLPQGFDDLQQVFVQALKPLLQDLQFACEEVASKIPSELPDLRRRLKEQKINLKHAEMNRSMEEAILKRAMVDNARSILAQALH